MRRFCCFVFLFVLFVVGQSAASAQFRIVNKLAEVKTIYLDRESFKITLSSCGRHVAGKFIPCEKDNREREKFFDALTRWLGKYGFSLTSDRKSADAVLEGDIVIDDDVIRKKADYEKAVKKDKDKSYDSSYIEASWSVRAWLVNDYGERIWDKDQGIMPAVSYKPSGLAKIEAKKLARKLQHDYRKAK